MKKILYFTLIGISFVAAQDFGYEYLMLSEYRSGGIGYNFQKFSPRASNILSDSNKIDFSTGLPMIELRQNNGRLAVGYQSYTTLNGKNKTSFSVYGETLNDIALSDKKEQRTAFVIPIVVAANYVRAESPINGAKDFDIGSLGVGTGLKFKHFDRNFGLQAFVIGTLYYASEGFSTEYGSQNSLVAEIQCIIPEIIYEGIIVGYRFESQRWNMNDVTLNYERQYNGLFVGVLF